MIAWWWLLVAAAGGALLGACLFLLWLIHAMSGAV